VLGSNQLDGPAQCENTAPTLTTTHRRCEMADPDLTFWSRVQKDGPNGCWEWTGPRAGKGYGRVHVGRTWAAHRYAWFLTNGPIPEGLFVCHHCDNPPCCNPAHLFVGTATDNVRDCVRKGRHVPGDGEGAPKGEKHRLAKLTAAGVEQMRMRFQAGTPVTTLAREFGVHPKRVTLIVLGEAWRTAAGPIAPRVPRRDKLSPEAREQIRRRLDESPSALAIEYGVHPATIQRARCGLRSMGTRYR
jgi:hypothetical protein